MYMMIPLSLKKLKLEEHVKILKFIHFLVNYKCKGLVSVARGKDERI